MQHRVVVLGQEAVSLDRPVPREAPGDRFEAIESLLQGPPEAVLVAAEGQDCFFRASLAMERGVRKVVIRDGALGPAVLREMAVRARALGAEVFTHAREGNRYERIHAPKDAAAMEIGVPDLEAWSLASRQNRGQPDRLAELGLVVSAEERDAARQAAPLPIDTPVAGLPPRLEETAFRLGLKPVLYLVVPPDELEALRLRHPGAYLETIETSLREDASTGVRHYDVGPTTRHVFLAADPVLARAAARLWVDGSSRNVREIGRLMGYPECCVAAYATLRSRANNAGLVYVTSARTRALRASYHPLLGGSVVHLVPFTPCTYGCARAVSWALRLVGELAPATQSAVRRAMSRPVLYLDQGRAVAFEGVSHADTESVSFDRAVFIGGQDQSALHARHLFGWLLGGGGTLRLTDEAFELEAGGQARRRLRRGDPALGVLMPFASF